MSDAVTFAEFAAVLSDNPEMAIQFVLPDRSLIPAHFHVTEVGRVQKDFVDCGGTVRSSATCVLQVWVANDTSHRLRTTKLAEIVRKGLELLKSTTLPVEVEFDNGLISQYPIQKAELSPSGVVFHLGSKHTACLAPDRCGVKLDVLSSCSSSDCC